MRYEWADAQVHRFDVAAFDVVISRYGAMFFADRLAAFTNLAAALRPGGRLAVLVWQALDRNPWLVALRAALAVGRDLPSPPPGAPGPFGLADTDAAAAMLTEAGYASIAFVPIEAPMQLGRDAEEAWEYLRGMGLYRGLTEGLGETDKADAIANVQQLISDHTTSAGVMVESAVLVDHGGPAPCVHHLDAKASAQDADPFARQLFQRGGVLLPPSRSPHRGLPPPVRRQRSNRCPMP